MSELISGKEALIAVVNGEKVEVKRIHDPDWQPALIFGISVFLSEEVKFRLKPRTIMIGDMEVPATFEPKVGETYWFIADYISYGYSDTHEGSGINSSIGKWRTEDEIKQVVAALRQVFKGATQ